MLMAVFRSEVLSTVFIFGIRTVRKTASIQQLAPLPAVRIPLLRTSRTIATMQMMPRSASEFPIAFTERISSDGLINVYPRVSSL